MREPVIAVLLAQGDELTCGQTIDTNSGRLAAMLWGMGVTVRRILSVPDRLDDLIAVMDEAAGLADVVIGTGGLGPTRDDLTAQAAAAASGVPLALRDEALAQVEARFAAMGRRMADTNRKQAVLPVGSTVLENPNGTAPGFALNHRGCRLYFLPGPPHEMGPMFEALVAPDILVRHHLTPPILVRIGVVMSESVLEKKLQGLHIEGLEPAALSVGFRASLTGNEVKLRLDPSVPEGVREALVTEILARLGDAVVGVGSLDSAAALADQLADRGETLAVAESCTGGALAARLVALPGASRYFLEGATMYSNAAKVRVCGVSPADLETHGAVSEPVARAMAEGIRRVAGSDWGLGITGITGPTGGRPDKPIGTVHLAIAGPDGTTHHHLTHHGDRARIIQRTVTATLMRTLQRVRST
ncbi:MAG: nicotinamide-nucleotide amidase [Myxococcota bacterium]|jgi:nicotinamide-nucleotide amidase